MLFAKVLHWVIARDWWLETHQIVRLHVDGQAFEEVFRWRPRLGRWNRIEPGIRALRLTIDTHATLGSRYRRLG